MECSCKAWKVEGPDNCKWAAETIKLMSSLPLNSPERDAYMSKFMKNTCNIPSNGVCCCGTEEKAPENSMDKVRIVKIMAIPVVKFLSFVALLKIFYQILIAYCKFIIPKALK